MATVQINPDSGPARLYRDLLETSRAYRQETAGKGTATAVDPDNQLLWRMRLRRLESEAIRDSLLAVS